APPAGPAGRADAVRTPPGRGPSRAQHGPEGPPQILIVLDDRAPARADEVLDLQVDRAPLVVGAQAEIAPVPDDALAAREGVPDRGRGAAVDICPVEDRDDGLGGVDRCPVRGAHLEVEPPPGLALRAPIRFPLHAPDPSSGGEGPGIEHVAAEALDVRNE